MSQADLAAATGDVVTESWLQKFENKHSPKYPTREQLEPLAPALGTSLAYLMAPMRVVPIEEVTLPDWRIGMRSDSRLDDDAKDTLEKIIDAFVDQSQHKSAARD